MFLHSSSHFLFPHPFVFDYMSLIDFKIIWHSQPPNSERRTSLISSASPKLPSKTRKLGTGYLDGIRLHHHMTMTGIEPLTSCLPVVRSTVNLEPHIARLQTSERRATLISSSSPKFPSSNQENQEG